jgi:hypothetical protein
LCRPLVADAPRVMGETARGAHVFHERAALPQRGQSVPGPPRTLPWRRSKRQTRHSATSLTLAATGTGGVVLTGDGGRLLVSVLDDDAARAARQLGELCGQWRCFKGL